MGRYHEFAEVEFRGDQADPGGDGREADGRGREDGQVELNGVNPDDVIREYGADVLRLYEMFMGDFELPKPWDPRAIEG